MKKLTAVLVILMFIISGCKTTPEQKIQEVQKIQPTYDDYLAKQKEVDENLRTEAEKDYKLSDPFIVVNPYGNSPLTAVVIFDSDKSTTAKVTVRGHDSFNNIETTFPAQTKHILPIYGLYQGEDNQVDIVLGDGTKNTVQITTDSLSSNMLKLKVDKLDKSQYYNDGLNFVSPALATPDKFNLTAYDSNGDLRWVLIEPQGGIMNRLSNGRFLVTTSKLVRSPYHQSGVREIDLIGKVYNEYLIPGGAHHDFVELPNGNFLVAGSYSDFHTTEAIINEIDRETGAVVQSFDLSEYVDPEDGSSPLRTEEDWFHNNAIFYDEKTDTILLSGRHQDVVLGIDYSDKKLKWILGDPEGWEDVDKKLFFKPVGQPFEWQYAQHAVKVLPNGDIFLFDNGAHRAKTTKKDQETIGDKVYSRAVIYRINTKDMTIRQIWQYGKERGPEWYSVYVSNVQYLGSNNYFLTSGGIVHDKKTGSYDIPLQQALAGNPDIETSSTINQIKDNKVVFEMMVPINAYRAYKFPMYTDKNTYDINADGKYLGSLGKTQTLSGLNVDNATELTGISDFKVSREFGRAIFSGAWATEKPPVKAVVALKNTTSGEIIGINVPTAAGPFAAGKNFSAWISEEGLTGDYDVYVIIEDKPHTTNYRITF